MSTLYHPIGSTKVAKFPLRLGQLRAGREREKAIERVIEIAGT